jgi:hypothetical protein
MSLCHRALARNTGDGCHMGRGEPLNEATREISLSPKPPARLSGSKGGRTLMAKRWEERPARRVLSCTSFGQNTKED